MSPDLAQGLSSGLTRRTRGGTTPVTLEIPVATSGDFSMAADSDLDRPAVGTTTEDRTPRRSDSRSAPPAGVQRPVAAGLRSDALNGQVPARPLSL